MSAVHAFFAWPDGGVWSNLLASLLWGPAAFTAHHVGMRRHHERATAAQTQELKDHIDARLSGGEGNTP